MKKLVKIINKDGLHARPASLFVKEANKFECGVSVEFKGKAVNAKSIVGIMSLGVSSGDEILIITEGRDEEKALKSLVEFIHKQTDQL